MTDTKTITFEGRSYTVPVWVEWVARNENGDLYGYEDRPSIGPFSFMPLANPFIGRHVIIFDNIYWADSLTKV